MYEEDKVEVVDILKRQPGLTRLELVKQLWPNAYRRNPYDIPNAFQTVLNQLMKAGLIERRITWRGSRRAYRYYNR